MYPTSNDYKIAIAKNARAHKLTGTVAGHSFDGGDVIGKSFVVKNQLCPATAIALGGVYIGELDLVFSKAFAESLSLRGEWKGKKITASIGVELFNADDDFEYVPIPGGEYTVEDAKWVDAGLQIVAYDNMGKFDKPVTMGQTNGKAYDILTYMCNQCEVILGLSRAQIEALPNGTRDFSLYPGSAIQTFRDMLSQLATALCCFATINRSGELVLRQLPDCNNIDATVPAKLRYSTSFSDFTSFYSMLQVENMKETADASSYYTNDNLGGLCLEIGANPFLQYGTSAVVYEMRQAIIDGLENFRAVPFKVSLLPDPSYDLGDTIQFPGGIGQNSLGCVMSFVMKVDSITLEGYGENPAAASVHSATDKAIEAQMSKVGENELVTHTFINVSPHSVGNHENEPIVEITFATKQPRKVIMLNEIMADVTVLDADNGAQVSLLYYLNDSLESYQPVGTFFHDGLQTLDRMFFYNNLEPGTEYDWRVEIKVDGGTLDIAAGDIHSILQGQGLVAVDEFTGTIRCEDVYEPIALDHVVADMTEAVNLFIATVEVDFAITDTINTVGYGDKQFVNLTDNCDLAIATSAFNIVDESGDYNVVDESGEYFIINEEGL